MPSTLATRGADRPPSPCPSAARSRRSRSRSRPASAGRLRPGAWPSWPTTWSARGWSPTSPTRACASSCARKRKSRKSRDWAAEHNVELAYTPHYGSWLNRIEAQFKALRYFTLDGTDHPDHATQARLIRRYIAWCNYNADDAKLREVVNTANVA